MAHFDFLGYLANAQSMEGDDTASPSVREAVTKR
jgi:hypothetical protein